MGFEPAFAGENKWIASGKSSDHVEPQEVEDEPQEPELAYLNYAEMLDRAKREPDTVAEISVNLYYTEEYAAVTKDMRGTVSI